MVRIWLYLNQFELASGGIDPAGVEQSWKEANQEYAFNYVVKAVEDYRIEVEPLIPDDEKLQDWFNQRPPAIQNQYKTGYSWSTEWGILSLPLSEGAAEKLLAAYPRPDEEDPDVIAKTYYDFNSFARFKKPERRARLADRARGLFAGWLGEQESSTPTETPTGDALSKKA